MNITDVDFLEKFNTDLKVGLVGHGFVGRAVEDFFGSTFTVLVNDRRYQLGETPDFQRKTSQTADLRRLVSECTVIFVAVPTPMMKSGQCHTGFIEEVVRDIVSNAKEIGRPVDSFIVAIKSTVPPGFTEDMQNRHFPMRIVFCPEFLTEKNSIQDFWTSNRVILGGEKGDAYAIFKFFEAVYPERVRDNSVILLQCDPTVAEMVKLFANGILATKILFGNEIYQMCQKLGIEYEEVRSLACLDKRIGSSHTLVPGPDGKLGFSGSCFPKDVNNLRYTCQELGVPEKLFSAVLDRNEELRGRDWEELKGRAVL